MTRPTPSSAMTRYAHGLLRHRIAVIAATLLATAILGFFSIGLKIVIDPVTMAPQDHPYVQATKRIDAKFGSKYLMVIAVTPEAGDIFAPGVLGTVQRMTKALESAPGVVRSTMVSVAARQAKGISGGADSFEARPLLDGIALHDDLPVSDADQAALKKVLLANPVYLGSAVSADFRTAAILVELKERSDGFRQMVEPVDRIVAAERAAHPNLKFATGGSPVYMETTERFADRINWLFPIALLVIGLLHFEAFRTWQGFVLPLVTALMAVLWGLGTMGVLGQPLDIFNSPTPILILAVAAGHAVQLLKRYYEEYEALRRTGTLQPEAANREAVVRSLAGVGPVMVIAGGVAALGFFSLMVFEIETIRTFGLFTGIGILSAVVLEMTFIPAVRSLLKPPVVADRQSGVAVERIWDRIPRLIADQVVPIARRRRLMIGLAAFCALCAAGMATLQVNSDSKTFFAGFLGLQQDDDFLNRTLGGSNALYVMVEGGEADSMKSPAMLRAVESTQRFAETLPGVGKTVSIVDHLKRMNRAMHSEDAAYDRLPDSRELVSQYLLLYSMSGEPGDFDSTIDSDFKTVKITLLLKTGGSAAVRVVLDRLKAHTAAAFGPNVRVSFGGEAAQTIALSDTLIKGKLLNIAQIAGAIFLISALAFRSLVAGVIVLAPLGCAVLAVFGTMGALGIPLNVPNSLISAMAVGIGADYAIYLLYRMRELARAGATPEVAVRQSLATAGKAALFVATAVAGGYGVLALSVGYNVHLWLSLFIVVAMVVSAAASLILVPSLVLYWQPAFVFQRAAARPMRWRLVGLLVAGSALAAATLTLPRTARADGDSALTLMQKNAAATKVKDSVSNATFTLTAKDGSTRVRKTTSQTRLATGSDDNMRLVRFVSPADIKGTSILLLEHAKADDDMWLYLPALGKVRRLSAANKKDAFVGTDFSYADVVGLKPEQWTHKLTGEEAVGGVPCHIVESLPADDAVRQTTGYGKRVSWIGKANFVALRTDVWDAAGQPLKRITATDVQQVGGNQKWQPMRTEAENLQTGHRTLIQFDGFQADRNVPESVFTTRELEK